MTEPDPLAALRASLAGAGDEPGRPPVRVNTEPGAVTPRFEDDEPGPSFPDMVTHVVGRLHEDHTSLGFLHAGGACGCRYVATLALGAGRAYVEAVPVIAE